MPASAVDSQEVRIPLTQVTRGSFARVACTAGLCAEDSELLRAMGISAETCLRVCGTRGACVLEVGDPETPQRTRVAVSSTIASRILVRDLATTGG